MHRSTLPSTCLALLVAALLAGGQQTMAEKQRHAATPAPTLIEAPDVAAMLDSAEAAFADDRLIGRSDDAHELFLAVLEIEPNNAHALSGIERIAETFIERARNAVRQERWIVARTLLDNAAVADANHPSLPSANTQLRQMRHAGRTQLDLSRDELRARRPAMAEVLATIGMQARKPNARVIIRAGSDAEGRWIYARLNDAPGDRRIRGEIEIGHPPRVVVFLLPEAAP